MTHYHFDNQIHKKNISRKKIVGVSFLVVGLAILIIFGLTTIIQTLIRGPQWFRLQAQEVFSETVSMLTPKKIILKQNQQLKETLVTYQAQQIELEALRDENIKLRTELDYISNPQESIFAQVLAKPSQSLYNSLIIDRGSTAGIQVGQLVVTQGSIGLGTVARVAPYSATVMLFSGPQFNEDMVMRNQNITVPAKGKGGGNFEIHIPREIEVSDGDILGLPYYPNISIGVVKSIVFDQRDPFQKVLARTPVNIQELNYVQVIK